MPCGTVTWRVVCVGFSGDAKAEWFQGHQNPYCFQLEPFLVFIQSELSTFDIIFFREKKICFIHTYRSEVQTFKKIWKLKGLQSHPEKEEEHKKF